MDDFELQLKRIPLAKPPGNLRERIFASEAGGPRILAILRRRVPLGWAAVFALLTGLGGMYLSHWLRPAQLPSTAVIVQIIKSPSERNPFNFTEPAADWLPGEFTGRVLAPEEI